MAAGLPPSPALDETIARGQAGLREDAQVVHGTLNLLKEAAGKTVAELAADSAFTGTFEPVHKGTVAVLGDSIAIQNSLTAGSGTTLVNYHKRWGFWTSTAALLKGRLKLIEKSVGTYAYGTSGAGIQTIINNGEVAALIAAAPEWAVVHWGTNSLVADGLTAAQTFADYVEGVEMMTAAGIKVVATTILPRVVSGETTSAQRIAIADCNRLIVDWARSAPNVVLCDWAPALIDPTTGDGDADYFRDNTHPDEVGATRMAKVLFDVLDPIIPKSTAPLASGMADSRAVLPRGKSLQEGTGGTFSGSNPGGGSGAISAGSVVYVDTGTTLVASKVARTDMWPGAWQQFVFSAATATGGAKLSMQTGTGFSVGDTVFGVVEYETDAASWAAKFVSAQLLCNPNSANTAAGNSLSADLTAMTEALYQPGVASGVLITPTIVIPSGTTSMRLEAVSGGGPHTIRWGRMQFYRVV